MKIKPGVHVMGLKPEILLACIVAEPILVDLHQEPVITSVTDSKHSRKSRHYLGYAVDLRTRSLSETMADIAVDRIREALGAEYYVAFEADHIHIQFNGTAHG